MLTRIRNAQTAHQAGREHAGSKLKLAVAGVLEAEGYVAAIRWTRAQADDRP